MEQGEEASKYFCYVNLEAANFLNSVFVCLIVHLIVDLIDCSLIDGPI